MRPRSLREVSRRDADPTENSDKGSLRRSNDSSDAVILLFAYVDKASVYYINSNIAFYGKMS